MSAKTTSKARKEDGRPVVQTVFRTRSETEARTFLRRARARGDAVGLVRIEGVYTRTGRRFRRYEVRQLILRAAHRRKRKD